MTFSAQIIHGRPRALSPAQETQAHKLYALGYHPETIAERFGVSTSTVRDRLGLNKRDHSHRQAYVPVVPLRMIVTPWFVDPRDGLQTRVVRAADQ